MQTETKVQYLTNEESYTQRRMLFKDIWETAMNFDEKEDIMNKPKVIKTLRLDEVDKCVVGKTKKQRIKNLRHVCNRILDFCDRQDADDVFYEQFATDGQEPAKAMHKIDMKHPKKKIHKGKKKLRTAKSVFATHKDVRHIQISVSARKSKTKPPKFAPPVVEIKTSLDKYKAKTVKSKPSPVKEQVVRPAPEPPKTPPPAPLEDASGSNDSKHSSVTRRKPVKKKHSKRKKPSDATVQSMSPMSMVTRAKISRRASPKSINMLKPLPQLTKIMIN